MAAPAISNRTLTVRGPGICLRSGGELEGTVPERAMAWLTIDTCHYIVQE
jgi:hypothetical protein